MLVLGVRETDVTLVLCALTACTNTGAVGAVGVTAGEGSDCWLEPCAFTACTVKVTDVPLVSPVIVVVVAGGFGATPVTVAVCPTSANLPWLSRGQQVPKFPKAFHSACSQR